MALVFLYIQRQVTEQMLEVISFSNEKAFTQANEMLSYRLERISGTVSSAFINTDFLPLLSQDRSETGNAGLAGDVRKINQVLAAMQNNADILEVFLYLSAADPLSDHFQRYGTMESISGASWFTYLQNSPAEAPWVFWHDAKGNRVISMLRRLYSITDFHTVIAVLCVNVNSTLLIDILQNAVNTQGTEVFLINTLNEVILSSGDSPDWPYHDNLEIFLKQTAAKPGSSLTLDGRHVFTSLRKTGHPDWYRPNWTLLSVTPLEYIQNPISRIIRGVMLAALVSTLIFFAFSFLFTSAITRRINTLIGGMREVQEGKFSGTIIPRGSDEITELMSDFNYMIKRIEFLLEENTRHISEARRNELIALQSQINPHFLYNTLDLINWTALRHDIPEIYETVQSLSRFYKLSLNQGRNIVPLSDELEHVKAYLDIQCRRFDGVLDWTIDVPENLTRYSIVKLTLQPLVENAILHGILKKESKRGTVVIFAREEEDKLVLTVRDNGAGIQEEKLNNFLQSGFGSRGGYGLSNINERIKLYYSEQYGLSIESKQGEYTCVFITLPRIVCDDHLLA
jgi:two-component system sensor histidine kinase YesM